MGARRSFKSIAQLDRGPLKRVLGVKDLFAVGYGDLGSSIYYALGVTALYALGATPIALGIAGLIFICTALTYAEMASSIPESGGSASFSRHAFNDLISFLAGWGLLLDYIVTIAISAFAISPYLSFISPVMRATDVQIGFTIGIILLLFFVNCMGVKHSTRLSLVLAALTLFTQVVLILIGAYFLLDLTEVFSQMHIGVANAPWSPSWPEFLKGLAMAMVAYTGIESIAQLSSETKEPERSLPRAVIYVMVTLVVMYLGISFVALSALSAQELGTTYIQDPIAGIVMQFPVGSRLLFPWVGGLAAILLFVAANAGLMGASRLAFNMGEYYQLPRVFSWIHPISKTPLFALLVFALLASTVVLWSRGELSFLADLYNFGAMVAFFSAHLSLIVLRIKKPDLPRPFRVPLNIRIWGHSLPIPALVGVVATFVIWTVVVITKPQGRYLGIAWMTAGTLMYLYFRKKKKIKAFAQTSIEKIKVPDYETFQIKKILVPTKGGVETETVQVACELAKYHGAVLTALHIIEVPYTLPLDSALPYRALIGQAILQRAEAIARELGVEMDLQIVHSRSIPDTILQLQDEGGYDLLVLGAHRTRSDTHLGLGYIVDRVVRTAKCRVWICTLFQ